MYGINACEELRETFGTRPFQGQSEKGVKSTIDPWQIKCDGKIKKQTEKMQDRIDKGQR